MGTGFGSAWLRAVSTAGPLLVGGVVTIRHAIETKGPVLEQLSP
ncbi:MULTISPECIES: hypothetical protein [unclassified Amycolatopsis]|nr:MULTISPECIES: hypothetical protein [unclassified Amycolatopsis]